MDEMRKRIGKQVLCNPRGLVTICVVCLAMGSSFAPAAETVTAGTADSQERGSIRVSWLTTDLSGVNANDAIAAIKVWADAIEEDLQLVDDIEVVPQESADGLEKDFRAGTLDFVGIPTYVYLNIEDYADQDNLLTLMAHDGSIYARYLILVRRDSGITGIEDLAGRRIRILKTGRTSSLSEMWLEVALHDAGLPPATRHFAAVNEVQKASKAVLSVFFGQADASIVNQSVYDGICELNPQIGRELAVIAMSDPVLPNVLCHRREAGAARITETTEKILNLHNNPYGHQILVTFKGDRMLRIDVADIDSARKLVEAWRQIGLSAARD